MKRFSLTTIDLFIPLLFAAFVVWYAVVFLTDPNLSSPDTSKEESANGNLAQGLVDGLAAPVWTYQYQPWAHGPLVFGLILAPVYRHFGSALLWIKLLGAVFAIGGVFVWTRLIRRAWGAPAAFLFILWMLAPPPYFAHQLHVVWANHMESIFLSGLLILFFIDAKRDAPGTAASFAFGLLAGFAAFFCFQNFLTIGAIALVSLRRWSPRRLAGPAASAAAGFLIGFFPHFLYRSATAYSLGFFETAFSPFGRWFSLFLKILPNVSGYSVRAASWAVFVLAVLGFAWAARGIYTRRAASSAPDDAGAWLDRILIADAMLFLAAYGFGKFFIDDPGNVYAYRYLLPLFPVGMAWTCRALADIFRRRGSWAYSLIVLAPLLAVGFHDVARNASVSGAIQSLMRRFDGHPLLARRGDDYHSFVLQNLPNSWSSSDDAVRSLEKLPRAWKPAGYRRFGERLLAKEEPGRIDGALLDLKDFRKDAASGIGMAALMKDAEGILSESTRPASFELFDRIEQRSPELADAYAAGLSLKAAKCFHVLGPIEEGLRRVRGEIPWEKGERAGLPMRTVANCGLLAGRMGRELPSRTHGALAYGYGSFRGAELTGMCLTEGDEDAAVPVLCEFLGIPDSPEIRSAFRRGAASGAVDFLVEYYNEVVFPNRPVLMPEIAEDMKARGLAVETLSKTPLRIRMVRK